MSEVPKMESMVSCDEFVRDLFGNPIETPKKARKKELPKQIVLPPEPPTKSALYTTIIPVLKKFCGELVYKTVLDTIAQVLSLKFAAIVIATVTAIGAVLQYEYNWWGKSKDALGHWTTTVTPAPRK
ncbi:hypothetical protein [Hyphomicrobium sp. DY-1]|uniref:hypothetical protein n=1 Tax=Hyphomicrobium sp. DY-1 TaxID=3075650 RepID=UPI0039C0F769